MRTPAHLVRVLCLGCVVAIAARTEAEELVYEKLNFAFEWPTTEGWIPIPSATGKAPEILRETVANEALGRTVSVVVLRTDPKANIHDADFAGTFKSALTLRKRATVTSDVVESFAGVPALKLWADIPDGDDTLRAHLVQFIANDRHYILAANSYLRDEDNDIDTELERALASFRFLEKPDFPDPEAAAAKRDWADRVGYLIGYYGVAVLIIAAFVYRLYYNAKQRERDREDRAYFE